MNINECTNDHEHGNASIFSLKFRNHHAYIVYEKNQFGKHLVNTVYEKN